MQINTSRFGYLEPRLGEEDSIFLPEGLIGFESLRKVFFVDSFEDSMICWLQSMEHQELAFSVLETQFFFPNYRVKFSSRELSVLDSTSELFIYSILSIPDNPREMTANLKAPIVINPKKRIALQVVLQESKYLIDYPVFKEIQKLVLLKPSLEGSSKKDSKEEKSSKKKAKRKYGVGNAYLGRKPEH